MAKAMSRSSRMQHDLKWGLSWTAAFAAVYILLAFVLYAVSPNDPSRLPLARVISAYVGGALVAGVLLGLLRPFAQTRTGSTMVGLLVGPCVYLCGLLVVLGRDSFSNTPGVVGVGLGGAFIGAVLGYKWGAPDRD
jgi:small-conductance mechanosensitive channel